MSSLCLRISKPDYESKYFNSYVNAYKKKKFLVDLKKNNNKKFIHKKKRPQLHLYRVSSFYFNYKNAFLSHFFQNSHKWKI